MWSEHIVWCLLLYICSLNVLISAVGVYLLLVYAVVFMYRTSIVFSSLFFFPPIGPISDGMYLHDFVWDLMPHFVGNMKYSLTF